MLDGMGFISAIIKMALFRKKPILKTENWTACFGFIMETATSFWNRIMKMAYRSTSRDDIIKKKFFPIMCRSEASKFFRRNYLIIRINF